jgi:hypothetical protein
MSDLSIDSEDVVEDSSLHPERKVLTSDGIEFIISTSDVIELTEKQFNNLAAIVLRRKSEYIRKDGVDIATLNSDQINDILLEIDRRIGDVENPLEQNLINISNHISDDHAVNPGELRRRGWYRDTIQELYDDIVSVIKEAHNVRKAKIKFNKTENKTLPTFTYTILGVKVNGDEGEVSIAFIEDNDDLILAVTII